MLINGGLYIQILSRVPRRPTFLKFKLKEGESSNHAGMIPNEVTTNLGLELPYTCYYMLINGGGGERVWGEGDQCEHSTSTSVFYPIMNKIFT